MKGHSYSGSDDMGQSDLFRDNHHQRDMDQQERKNNRLKTKKRKFKSGTIFVGIRNLLIQKGTHFKFVTEEFYVIV